MVLWTVIHRISETETRRFIVAVLNKRGIPGAEASIVADVIVTANLLGIDSHGIVRLTHYARRLANGTLNANPKIHFEQTSPTTGIIDGDDGLGHVVAFRAYERLSELTKSVGTATVVVRNSSHFGIAGYYARRLLERGFIGMVMTPSDALLIPFGGSKPFFGTNPIAVGFPHPIIDGIKLPPVVLDMATTEIPYGKIVLAQKERKPIPPNWGFDSDGKPTTDADNIAGLHPIAGPKGSGLAMMIDLFCSLLAGMPFGPNIPKMYQEMDRRRQLSHFLSAWDVSRFRPVSAFAEDLGRMIAELRTIPPAEGFDRVYYPGEIEAERMNERRAKGIPIEEGLHNELVTLAHELGVEPPRNQ